MEQSYLQKEDNGETNLTTYITGIEAQILEKMQETGKPLILERVYRKDGSLEGVKITLCPL
jgi:hypothetical protein